MKRIFILSMVLTLCGMALSFEMSSGETAPQVTVCMRSTTTGLPVTGITAAHVALKYGQGPLAYMSAIKTGEAVAYNAAWAEPTSGYVGWCEEITSGSTGPGTYRIYLPAAFLTNSAPRQTRTIEVISSTDSASSLLQVQFTPPDSSLTGRLESVIMENGCTSPTIYVVMARILNGVETIGTGLTIANFDLYYTEYRSSTATKIDISALAAANSAYGGGTGVSKAYEIAYGIYRVDLPPEAVDGGQGTTVRVFITDGTYSARKEIQLTPAVNAVLANGTTPPTSPADLTAAFADVTAHTDYIPSVATGSPGALLIAGGNAPITFESMTLGTTDLMAEVAKIPKSDSTVSWNATALAAIAGAIWNASTASHTGAGTFGLQNNTLTTDMALIPKSNGSVSLNATALSAIATVIQNSVMAVPTPGNSPDTPTVAQALSWLYSLNFNKKVTTDTEIQLFKRDETTKIMEQKYSDDGTALTVGEAKVAD